MAASSAPAPSLRLSPSSSASLRAASAGALALGGLRLLAGLGQPLLEVARAPTAAPSCSASRPSSPASSPAIRVSSAVKSRWARSARASGLLAGAGQPADLLVGGGGPALERVDLAVQPGQALAAVGGGAQQAGDPALLLGVRLLGLLAGGERPRRARRGCAATSASISLLLRADPLGLGPQLLGVAARPGGRLGARRRRCGPARRPGRRCP